MALLAAVSLLSPPLAAEVASEEVLVYRWHLGGVAGTVARIFVPGKGEGRLTTATDGGGVVTTELTLTSGNASRDEYWSYGARLRRRARRPFEVWNESRYKEREKRREAKADGEGWIDIPSGIHLLRTEPPERPLDLPLWADGKVYPVRIEPGRRVLRKVEGERRELVHFEVVGRDVPGERRWKGGLEIWLTPDERSIPVEIVYRRDRGKVHLELVAPPV